MRPWPTELDEDDLVTGMERPDGRGFKTFRTFDKRRDVVYGKSLLIVRYSHMTPQKNRSNPSGNRDGLSIPFFKGVSNEEIIVTFNECGFRIPRTCTSRQKKRGSKLWAGG